MDQLRGSLQLDILEIGVFRGDLLKALVKRDDVAVNSYTGIDPYLGDLSDSYTGAYWKNRTESSSVFESTKRLFEQNGHTLHRTFSHEYYGGSRERKWDVVIVDGDHSFAPAYWDLGHWFGRVRAGGLLLADDYANADTPEVTRAVNAFVDANGEFIRRSGYQVLPFLNDAKSIPISLTVVYFERNDAEYTSPEWPFPVEYGTSGRTPRLVHYLRQPVKHLLARFGVGVYPLNQASDRAGRPPQGFSQFLG